MEQDPANADIIRCIIGMGKALNLQTIAEGVETQQNKDFLAYAGCDEIQGYFISKPIPASEFEKTYPSTNSHFDFEMSEGSMCSGANAVHAPRAVLIVRSASGVMRETHVPVVLVAERGTGTSIPSERHSSR